MKSVVVYFTKFGNTQRVAEAIARVLEQGGPARLLGLDELSASTLDGADLVVMGSPTHNMNLPEQARRKLAELPKKTLRGREVAAFDTSYEMNALLNRFTAGKRLDRFLRRLGGRRLARPELFVVTGREGPLADGELERAGAWAATLLARAQASA